jgi:superfamily II DNA or RNA helicase
MKPLFEAVREACSRRAWSRGVELARAGAVSAASGDAGEVLARVVTPGRVVAPAVALRPAQALWDCDCRSLEDPCEHVAAAVIALRRALESGEELPQGPGAVGALGYRLRRAAGGLHLERVVVDGGGEVELRGTLAALASGRVPGPRCAPGEADLEVERALGPTLHGVIPPGVLRRLLAPLARCADVRLDGVPVRADPEPVRPVVRVDDCPQGFRLALDAPAGERLAEGVVLCGDALRPLGASGLTGREAADYERGLVVPLDEAGRLATEILPQLRERAVLEVRSARLPTARAEPPRLRIAVEREGDALSVLATLVYGDPACARIDAGRLVHLGGPVPIRDPGAESRLVRRLASALGLAPGHRERATGEAALALAERLRAFDGEILGTAHGEFFPAAPLAPRLEVAGDRFALDFETPDAGGGRRARVGAGAVLRAWREGESLVALEGGGFAPLPAEWLDRFGDRVASLLEARDARGEAPACLLPDLAELCESVGAPAPAGFARLRALVGDFTELPAAALPPDLRADLRPYQRRGVDWLVFHREAGLGALLADDMGLGKTLQALCAMTGRTLVVCPTSVLVAWTEQAGRFRPALRVCLYHGAERSLDPAADLTFTSYALLRGDEEALAAVAWDTIVLDESQAIKNPESQVARAAHRLRGRFRIALTGTPVENRLTNLWSQLQFLNPGLLGARRDFEEGLARRVAAGDARATAQLRARLHPFVLRRMKSQVARDLPPRTEVVLHCELGAEERAVYEAVRAATRAEVVERLRAKGGVLLALEALLRLRQAACHPGLVPGQRAGASAKLDCLLEELDCAVAEGHRALVFSQWTKLLDLVEPRLREAAIAFGRLDGATRDRAGVVADFQREDGPPVLLVSLRAGGTGLDLTAADHVFLLDPWWNPAVEDQAADRAHRIGQTRPVLVHRLVARETVEERILALQARKRSLADSALGGLDPEGALTREDLLALLD